MNPPSVKSPARHPWTFFSNHGHVLVAIANDPEARVRDLADAVGITERAVLLILGDLEAAGVIVRHREGRRTTYAVVMEVPLRHPLEQHRTVGDIVGLVRDDGARSARPVDPA